MSVSVELKKIKKTYGEEFMHLCRKLFPTILENEGKLFEILTERFSDNCKTLYEDITREEAEYEFKYFILEAYKQKNEPSEKQEIITEKSPYELLDEAGYNLYECHTEEDIQQFKKYYAEREQLCTFRGERLKNCVVFFAVRKDINTIKREDFKNPKRQDEYGTSVLSIQFYKTPPCVVSIKNRYNHRVINPDATYGNNLDAIIPGLKYSFKKLLLTRGIGLQDTNNTLFELYKYVTAADGKMYKYNAEEEATYVCPGNIVIKNGVARKIGDPEKVILIDGYIVDLEHKRISVLDEFKTSIEDNFLTAMQDIKDIKVEKDREAGNGARIIKITHESEENPTIIEINKNNQITGLTCRKITYIGKNFMLYSSELSRLILPNLKEIDLFEGNSLEHVDFPNVERIGNNFLLDNRKMKEIRLPKAKSIGSFFGNGSRLEIVEIPQVEEVGEHFCSTGSYIKSISAENLRKTGNNFLGETVGNIKLYVPLLKEVGDFFCCRSDIEQIDLPSLEKVGNSFFEYSMLKHINAPKLEEIGDNGFSSAKKLEHLQLEKLRNAGEYFCSNNDGLQRAYFPNLESVGPNSFNENHTLKILGLPRLTLLGYLSINKCENLHLVNAPRLERVDSSFWCENLKTLGLPRLRGPWAKRMKANPNIHWLNGREALDLDKNFENYFEEKQVNSEDIARMAKDKKIALEEVKQAGKYLIERIINLIKSK